MWAIGHETALACDFSVLCLQEREEQEVSEEKAGDLGQFMLRYFIFFLGHD